jgi:hypothetical protein
MQAIAAAVGATPFFLNPNEYTVRLTDVGLVSVDVKSAYAG